MNLVDELFSAGLMDLDGCRCGRVDDVLVDPGFDGPARVTALLSGKGCKSRLIAPWAHRLSILTHRVLGMQPPIHPTMIPWERVKLLNDHVGIAASSRELGLDTLSRAAARRWIGRIPGSGYQGHHIANDTTPGSDPLAGEGLSLESLMGRRVLDVHGRVLGRIYSFTAQWEHGDLLVTDVCIGVAAWLELLWPDQSIRRALTRREPVHAPWQTIDPSCVRSLGTRQPIRLRTAP